LTVELQLIVVPAANEEADDTVRWSEDLVSELESLDYIAEIVVAPEASPEGAKGEGGFASLLAQVPLTAVDAVVRFVRAWATRSGRTVQATIAGDTICIRGASRDQADQLLAAWIARHSSGT
jgi:hypothetical protein